MKSEEVKKLITEVIEELAKREMLKPNYSIAYSSISDRLYDFYEAGAKDYDIQTALKELENDSYFRIIPLYFAELNTIEQIAEKFNVEVSTITRNKKRLCLEIHKILSRL